MKDVIIEACAKSHIYDLTEIDNILEGYGCEKLVKAPKEKRKIDL